MNLDIKTLNRINATQNMLQLASMDPRKVWVKQEQWVNNLTHLRSELHELYLNSIDKNEIPEDISNLFFGEN